LSSRVGLKAKARAKENAENAEGAEVTRGKARAKTNAVDAASAEKRSVKAEV